MLPGMAEAGHPIRKVLVPVDLGRRGSAFCSYAIALAKQLAGEILFFSVIDSPTMLYLIESRPSHTGEEGFRDNLVADAQVLLKRLVDLAAESGVRATGHAVVSERVDREVTREASERSVDLIIVDAEAHSRLWRLLFGASAEEILHRAPCPVLSFKQRSKEK